MARRRKEDMELLTVGDIVALGRERLGVEIPQTSIRSALERGHIVGGVKKSIDTERWRAVKTPDGGRWHAPRWAVLAWLEEKYRAPVQPKNPPFSG